MTQASRAGGATLAFGSPVVPRYHFDRAQVVLALDCDFLGLEEEGTRHHRGFSRARLGDGATPTMNRLYVVESRFSLTGGMADHRLRLPSSQVAEYTRALARELTLGETVVPAPGSPEAALRQVLSSSRPSVGFDERWVREVAADLKAHAGQGIVIAGRRQPPLVHALAFAMNAALGNLGKTIELHKPPARPTADSLAELAEAIKKGEVETLVILGGNPAYDAPADLDFASLMKRVKTTIRLGLHADETSREATWHLPAAHYLESWGDARAGDGTLVPIQPLIEPLFGGRNVLEEVARLSEFETTSPYEIVRRAFRKVSGVAEADFEAAWRRFLHDGLPGRRLSPAVPALKWDTVAQALTAAGPGPRLCRARTSSWSSTATPRSTTAGSPTTAGCRSSPTRSPS